MTHDAPLTPGTHGSQWAPALIVAVALGCSAAYKVFDPDVWWHARAGQWILEHRALPWNDPFSHTAKGRWINAEAVSQLLFGMLDHIGGPAAWIAFSMAFVAALALVIARLARVASGPSPHAVAVAISVTIWGLACHHRFGPKTEMFSWAGFAVLLALLLTAEREGKVAHLLWSVPLLLVWGNLHRGGTVAIVVLLASAAVWAARASSRRLALGAVSAAALGLLALMANPAGWRYVASGVDLVSRSSFRALLPEWDAMRLEFLWRHDPAFAPLVSCWLLLWLRRRRFDLETVLVMLTLLLSLRVVRLVPLAATAMLPGVCRGLGEILHRFEGRLGSAVRPALLRGALVAACVGAVALRYFSWMPVSAWGFGVLDWRVPVHSAQFLKDNPPPAPMWNGYNAGGALLYSLGPEQKVFIDGRNDTVYSDEFFQESVSAERDPAVLARQLDTWGIRTIVLPCTRLQDPRHGWLYDSGQWALVYLDDLTAVLVRRSENTLPYVARHAYNVLRPDNALNRALDSGHDPERALFGADVLRYAELAPHSVRAMILLALVARQSGDANGYQEARTRAMQMVDSRELSISVP